MYMDSKIVVVEVSVSKFHTAKIGNYPFEVLLKMSRKWVLDGIVSHAYNITYLMASQLHVVCYLYFCNLLLGYTMHCVFFELVLECCVPMSSGRHAKIEVVHKWFGRRDLRSIASLPLPNFCMLEV